MNLSLEADLLPRTHAGGGEADIVWEYEAHSGLSGPHAAHRGHLVRTRAASGGWRWSRSPAIWATTPWRIRTGRRTACSRHQCELQRDLGFPSAQGYGVLQPRRGEAGERPENLPAVHRAALSLLRADARYPQVIGCSVEAYGASRKAPSPGLNNGSLRRVRTPGGTNGT